jgi:hypothetical protein
MGAAKQSEPLQAGHRAPDFQLTRLLNETGQGNADLAGLLAAGRCCWLFSNPLVRCAR